jgi:hypothetical protein
MEARDAWPTHRDSDPPMSVQGPDPVSEPGAYAELYGLFDQVIRHLESSDFRSASAKLERACNRAASLREAYESPGLDGSRTPQIRHADAGPVSGEPETAPRPTRSRGT